MRRRLSVLGPVLRRGGRLLAATLRRLRRRRRLAALVLHPRRLARRGLARLLALRLALLLPLLWLRGRGLRLRRL